MRGAATLDRCCGCLLVWQLLLVFVSAGTWAQDSGSIVVERGPDGILRLISAPKTPTSPTPARRSGAQTALRKDYDSVIRVQSERAGLDPELVRSVIAAESDFDRWALSSKGAMGLMQLMPATAAELGVEDPWDPAENIRGGVTYLQRLLQKFSGDLRLALAAYNAGPGVVERQGGIPPYRETVQYVERVLSSFEKGLGVGARVHVPGSAATAGSASGDDPTPSYRPFEVRRDGDGHLVLVSQD